MPSTQFGLQKVNYIPQYIGREMNQFHKKSQRPTTIRRSRSQPSFKDRNPFLDQPPPSFRLPLSSHTFTKPPFFQTQRKINIKREKFCHLTKRIATPQLKRRMINKHKEKQSFKIRISEAFTLLNSDITTKCWCLFDSSTNRYLGFRETYKRQIASLTKIMTTLVSIQIIHKLALSPTCKVKITSSAAAMIGTSAYLKTNYWITLNDLLYGTMLPSGNDAAYCLAEYIGFCLYLHKGKTQNYCSFERIDLSNDYTVPYVLEFIRFMNEKAVNLNLRDTHFCNPHGLPNAFNTSSAKNIVKLSAHCSKNSLFRKIVNTQQYQYQMISEQGMIQNSYRSQWQNTNKLLQKGWQGIKTGQTASAGSCLSSLKSGIYIVVLNCLNTDTRFMDVQKIYQWYKSQHLIDKPINRQNDSQVDKFILSDYLSTQNSL